jgi:hypothetical protein
MYLVNGPTWKGLIENAPYPLCQAKSRRRAFVLSQEEDARFWSLMKSATVILPPQSAEQVHMVFDPTDNQGGTIQIVARLCQIGMCVAHHLLVLEKTLPMLGGIDNMEVNLSKRLRRGNLLFRRLCAPRGRNSTRCPRFLSMRRGRQKMACSERSAATDAAPRRGNQSKPRFARLGERNLGTGKPGSMNPNGVTDAIRSALGNPVGVQNDWCASRFPGCARSVRPWALLGKPVGVYGNGNKGDSSTNHFQANATLSFFLAGEV